MGPDGNFWTLAVGNKVGRLTRSGRLGTFAVPGGAKGLGAITAGPDGAAVVLGRQRGGTDHDQGPSGGLSIQAGYQLPTRRLPRGARAPTVTASDLVRRIFRRDRPNELWITDITEHPTRRRTYALTAAEMASDTAALMRALRIGRADVLGWSMGGQIAPELTLRYPQMVRRLVRASAFPGGSTSPQTANKHAIAVSANHGPTAPELLSTLFRQISRTLPTPMSGGCYSSPT